MPDPSTPLVASDRSLVRAAIAFGGPGVERLWSRFTPAWRDRLREGWAGALARGNDPQTALSRLRSDHNAEARPDPARVHPSWWVRALRDESPAVRLAVAARAPEPIASALRGGLDLDPAQIEAARAALVHEDCLAIARALWAERIVGGPPPDDDDPPVVIALTTLNSRPLARLIVDVALAKWSYALGDGGPLPGAVAKRPLTARQCSRVESFRGRWTAIDPRAAKLARHDLEIHVRGKPGDLRGLGLVTFGRLLLAVEPFRARWTLQHLPYPIAGFVRTQMERSAPFLTAPSRLRWESEVLRAARERDRSDVRFTLPRPGGGPP